MKRLYRAANLPEAHLLRHLLQQSGIESHVFNENAQGGIGQLPFTEAYPEIWIEHEADMPVARAVIDRYESRAAEEGEESLCGGCGQMNPAGFELCWSCGGAI